MKLNSMDMLEDLMEFLSQGGDGSQVAEILKTLYEGKAKSVRPLLKAAVELGGTVGKDLAPVGTTILRLVNELREDKDFKKEMDRLDRNLAISRQAELKAYMKAGFKRNEAMALLLKSMADMAAMQSGLKNIKTKSS